MSRRLLSEFGSLSGVFTATPEAIENVAGKAVSRLLIKARDAVQTSFREAMLRAPCRVESPAFRQYVRSKLQNLRDETLLAFFLDCNHCLIADEFVAQGGVLGLEIAGRTLFRRALELNAVALVLAHNHPSGVAAPSESDITATNRLILVAASMDIRLLDHLIVGRGEISSMRLQGLLK